ncbi:unnamed protein product [Protopolystoma xenopodis]|uniref:Uncharacterized protein n=1 Tax=Protopolystoma xenopodis TaxID=117903 RepID=A0A448X7H3_9PLAT|nr:unnamed protein product [Protopolystoma xenopodis]
MHAQCTIQSSGRWAAASCANNDVSTSPTTTPAPASDQAHSRPQNHKSRHRSPDEPTTLGREQNVCSLFNVERMASSPNTQVSTLQHGLELSICVCVCVLVCI